MACSPFALSACTIVDFICFKRGPACPLQSNAIESEWLWTGSPQTLCPGIVRQAPPTPLGTPVYRGYIARGRVGSRRPACSLDYAPGLTGLRPGLERVH